MSRRKKTNGQNQPLPTRRNTRAERPQFTMSIAFLSEGRVEVDPKYNDAFIEQIDTISSDSEEYDIEWTDDHKIAWYMFTLMDGFLSQWDTPISPDEVDGDIADVPHINESPVVDKLDLANAEIIK